MAFTLSQIIVNELRLCFKPVLTHLEVLLLYAAEHMGMYVFASAKYALSVTNTIDLDAFTCTV